MNTTKNIYSKKDMSKLDTDDNIKYFPLIKDYVIKNIFYNNPDILKRFLISQIKDIVKLNPETTKMTINNTELGKSNYKEYNETVDTYVVLNNNIHIDLEYNTSPYSVVQKRNKQYLNKLANIILESGDKISKLNDIYIIQVNLNASVSDKKYGEDLIISFGKKTNKEYEDYMYIVLKNIDYYRNLFYNEHRKLAKDELCHVAISSRNFEELFTTLGLIVSNEERNKIIKEVINMFKKKFILEEWKKEHAEALNAIARHDAEIYYRNEGKEEGRIEGRIEGRQEGIQEGLHNALKAMTMLKEKRPLDLISKVTGVSIQEIKNIQKNMS